MYISDEDFEKFEYLVGFVNTVAEIVCDPEEMMDPNIGDSTVFAVGYSVGNDDTVELSTIDGSEEVEDFKDNLAALESEIKLVVRKDFSKQWQELQR